tara:strand:- start:96 stop:869 length:774 start_codon:yes stop_codon:yes gene_type:complete
MSDTQKNVQDKMVKNSKLGFNLIELFDPIELTAGAVGGISQILVGHPFDTVKVYKQTGSGVFNISARHIYRGSGYPFAAAAFASSLQFSAEGFFKRVVGDESEWDRFISGGLAGFVGVPLMSITELYRIRRQKFNSIKDFKYSRGMKLTAYREVPSVAIYFGVYGNFKRLLKDSGMSDTPATLIAGGVGGALSWLCTYPIDVIKTRVQSGECNTFKEARRMGNLWRGVGWCTSRAAVVNSVQFLVFEKVKKMLEDDL